MKQAGDKTRILHFIGGGELGGAEELLLTLMKHLDKEQYEAQLICLCPGPFAELVRQYGFKATEIPMRHKFDLSTIQVIRQYLRENKIDLVHTHGVRANLVARTAARKEGLPVVTTFHSVLRYDYDSIFKALLAKYLTIATNKCTDKFIAISRAIKQEILQMGVPEDRITVIHNGLDISKYAEPRDPQLMKTELGLDPDKYTVAMIARLHPVKGHQYFLQAAREILNQGLAAQFLIIGEGIYREKIKEWIKELGLDEAVVMPGYYSPIENIYGVCDVLCVPSLMEGLGMVVLEAMHFNVPVAASDIGGIQEIIEDRINGLLVQPRDAKGLADAVVNLLIDKELAQYFREQGQKTLQEFTLEKMARQIEQTYHSLS